MTSRTSINDRKSRKRELDRKSQRLARQRTRSRMAHLETLVASFQEADEDARFSSLIEQLSELTNFFPLRSSGIENADSAPSRNSSDGAQAGHNPESLDIDHLLFQLPPLSQDFFHAALPQVAPLECECMLGTSYDTGSTLSIWRQLNDLYQPLVHADLAAEDRESEDSIIRAVLYGWNSVGAAGRALTTYRTLRTVDELHGVKPNPTDRLALLGVMRLMLISQSSTRKAELPRWLQARPSQNLPHAAAIDFVFWPGVRERMVFSEHEYCSGSFWRGAYSSTRLIWPLRLSDAYVLNSVTGKFHFSPSFRMFIRDLRNWTVSPEFLKQYPELHNDIKGY
ncbi:uncharacterized protein FSUBG_4798 [Fusarium subglutinans]|uniref:BZIP transcription factor n=1 Tax=Gibberella subglutinans TaxID=42677 RepID=A0A8H5Q409_GIBSU|nr:uncharacterized protein FSUBG_4798 [Fusarium subglutinans]KAF5608262.1 hypothetical protein FSUBG_4798 [Fusarium subglutinans]